MDRDSWLIGRMKVGDEDAVEDFVRKYYSLILRYCRMHIVDAGDAEDAVQETFEKFFRSFDRYRHYGKAANYLYVIAGNVCKDHYRKPQLLPMDMLLEESSVPIERAEQRMTVRWAIGKLPDELRETAILYFCQELKQREIAKILQIGLPLVKYRIKRSRQLLTEYLREEETEDVVRETI